MPAPAAQGSRLGPYALEAELGRGGMGIVYRAIDSRLGRRVALKVVQQQLAGDLGLTADEMTRRLRHEAQLAARLSHPNIVTIFAYEEIDNVSLIAMEFVDGQSLADLLAKGHRWSPADALHLAEQVADGLRVAHAGGIVHRDLKPANLMLTREGRVKVLDFGIARFNAREGEREGSRRQFGTVHYMAPEQVLGGTVTASADVWALGVVTYELIMGTALFQTDSTISAASQITRGVRFATGRQWTPPGEDAVVYASEVGEAFGFLQCAISGDVARRFPHAGAVQDHLQRQRGTPAKPLNVVTGLRAATAKPLTIGLLALLIVTLLVGAVALLQLGAGGARPRARSFGGGGGAIAMPSAALPLHSVSGYADGTFAPLSSPTAGVPTPPAPGPYSAPLPTQHFVEMIGDSLSYHFEPDQLTVRRGDAVSFVLLSGGPHNVAFDGTLLPADVRARLLANMPNQAAELMGPMMLAAGEEYTISFASLAPGTYEFFCTPHLAMGMKGSITVIDDSQPPE